MPFSAEVLVGAHLFLLLPCLGVRMAGLRPGLPRAFAIVVGFLRIRCSVAPVGWAVPLGLEWAGFVQPVLGAGGLQLLRATVLLELGLAVAPDRSSGLDLLFAAVRVFLPSFGGQQPIFLRYLGTPLGGRFEPGLLATGRLLRCAFGRLVWLHVPDVNHSSWSVR